MLADMPILLGRARGAGETDVLLIVIGIVAAVVLLIAFAFVGQLLHLFLQASVSGAPVRMLDLIGMRLRRVNAREVVLCRIRLMKAGIDVPVERLEVHVLAGGSLPRVVMALISAKGAGKPLTWEEATARDLAIPHRA